MLKKILPLILLLFIMLGVSEGATEKWILIDKGNFALTLYDGEDVLNSWGIAVGKNHGDKQRKGDMRTPNGTFKIQSFHDSKTWTHDFKDGKGVIKGAYGPWFIRLKTSPWTGIGIHGTHDPESIGTRVSEGCIRLKNEDLLELKKQTKIGMKVVIKE